MVRTVPNRRDGADRTTGAQQATEILRRLLIPGAIGTESAIAETGPAVRVLEDHLCRLSLRVTIGEGMIGSATEATAAEIEGATGEEAEAASAIGESEEAVAGGAIVGHLKSRRQNRLLRIKQNKLPNRRKRLLKKVPRIRLNRCRPNDLAQRHRPRPLPLATKQPLPNRRKRNLALPDLPIDAPIQ